ncbi:hypothetical protein FRB90_009007, partial [Tulasnella sp. 427]
MSRKRVVPKPDAQSTPSPPRPAQTNWFGSTSSFGSSGTPTKPVVTIDKLLSINKEPPSKRITSPSPLSSSESDHEDAQAPAATSINPKQGEIPSTSERIPSPMGSPRFWGPPPAIEGMTQGFSKDATLGEYAQRSRALLDILKDLHSTGIQNELDLPKIVVVGSQSVGKSSLIESISGITLPRNSGTCTRCPMECRLQQASSWSCQVVLRFQFDAVGKPLAEMREITFGPVIYDRDEVTERLGRAQSAILNPSIKSDSFLEGDVQSTPDSLTFSANCVCVRVAGPNVPDLYFYDLPGVIANVSDGGQEGDIELVDKLAMSNVSRPNCLVLLVITCDTDFENQKAGRLVLKSKDRSLKDRTVGVLTKVDRIQPGDEDRWLKILQGEEL